MKEYGRCEYLARELFKRDGTLKPIPLFANKTCIAKLSLGKAREPIFTTQSGDTSIPRRQLFSAQVPIKSSAGRFRNSGRSSVDKRRSNIAPRENELVLVVSEVCRQKNVPGMKQYNNAKFF